MSAPGSRLGKTNSISSRVATVAKPTSKSPPPKVPTAKREVPDEARSELHRLKSELDHPNVSRPAHRFDERVICHGSSVKFTTLERTVGNAKEFDASTKQYACIFESAASWPSVTVEWHEVVDNEVPAFVSHSISVAVSPFRIG